MHYLYLLLRVSGTRCITCIYYSELVALGALLVFITQLVALGALLVFITQELVAPGVLLVIITQS